MAEPSRRAPGNERLPLPGSHPSDQIGIYNQRDPDNSSQQTSECPDDSSLFSPVPVPKATFGSALFRNNGPKTIFVRSKGYFDPSSLHPQLSLSGTVKAFGSLSYSSGFFEFQTPTMAQHALNRMKRNSQDYQFELISYAESSFKIHERELQIQLEYTSDNPRCLVAHNIHLPSSQIDDLMLPFSLHSYEFNEDYLVTFHQNAASASDFIDAFEHGQAGIDGTWVTDGTELKQTPETLVDTRLLNFYVSTDSVNWSLSKRRPPIVKKPPIRKKKEPRGEPTRFERSVMRVIEEGSRTFEEIKQPKIKRESSRLTPVHKIKEWHKREYLRPYAQARRQQSVVFRASGSPMCQSQFVNQQELPKRRRSAQQNVGSGVAGKRVYFEKSPIQGYGLFALEPIDAGEFICEYYGEMIRMEVADKRERQFDKQGFQHTYMFRLGEDVIDATNHGSLARFLNSSCKPNCRAEEIKIQNANTVSFFAIRRIKAHDEIVFDFKMELADCMEHLERCYCGASRCNGFLNYSIYEGVLKARMQKALC